MSESAPPSPPVVSGDYEMACVLVELLLAGKPQEVQEVITGLPTGEAQISMSGAVLSLCAEVLRDVSDGEDIALTALHRIRREAHKRG